MLHQHARADGGLTVPLNGYAATRRNQTFLRLPTVHIVVVNYRTAALTIDCLHSLATEVAEFPGTRVTVVDNASGDGSACQIGEVIERKRWQTWVELMALDENRGFSHGNNAVLRRLYTTAAPPDYVWLLNPDTRVRRGALRELVRYMEAHGAVGIAGSRLEDPDGTPQRSAFRFHTALGELCTASRLRVLGRLLEPWVVAPPPSERPCAADWVAGASMMIRREVLDSVGWFDEDYFLYYEEVDYCLRACRSGWQCGYVPTSRVIHMVGQSTGVTDASRRTLRRPEYWFESRRRYFVKNFGRAYAALADIACLTGSLSRRIRCVIKRAPHDEPSHFLRDLVRHSALLLPWEKAG